MTGPMLSLPSLSNGDMIVVPDEYDEWNQGHRLVRRSGDRYVKIAGQVGTVDHFFPRWQNESCGFYLVLTPNWSLVIPQDMAESAVRIERGNQL